jgi:hypothetical protein
MEILLGMAGDQVEQGIGTVNMARGDWEQSMEILLGMAGDQVEQGTVNITRGDREQQCWGSCWVWRGTRWNKVQ